MIEASPRKLQYTTYSDVAPGQDFYHANPADAGWCRAMDEWTEHYEDGTEAAFNAYTPWGPDWFAPGSPVQVVVA